MKSYSASNTRSIGQIIKEARKAKRLTQAQLAELLDVCDERLIRMWESGERLPRLEHRKKLADVLGLLPEVLGVREADD